LKIFNVAYPFYLRSLFLTEIDPHLARGFLGANFFKLPKKKKNKQLVIGLALIKKN
jgi:hypothetical protein